MIMFCSLAIHFSGCKFNSFLHFFLVDSPATGAKKIESEDFLKIHK